MWSKNEIFRRVSFINIAGLLHLYDLEGKGNEIANFERKDVWDMKWDEVIIKFTILVRFSL